MRVCSGLGIRSEGLDMMRIIGRTNSSAAKYPCRGVFVFQIVIVMLCTEVTKWVSGVRTT